MCRPSLQHRTGFTEHLSNAKVDRDQQTRGYFQADARGTRRRRAAPGQGRRAVRPLGNDVLTRQLAAVSSACSGTRHCRRARPFTRGTVRLLRSAQQRRRPEQGDHHRGQRAHDERRVVRAGLVDDQQPADDQRRRPDRAREGAGLHDRRRTCREFGIKFGFADKLAPRAGFAYDLKGDGKHEGVRFVGHLLRHLQA